MVSKLQRFVFSSLTGLLLLSPIAAESLEVTATVDKNKVAVGEAVSFEVTIRGEDLSSVPNPKLPKLAGRFRVEGSAVSDSFSFANGKISSSKSIRYTLIPIRKGRQTIGAASIRFNGQVFKTNPIAVEVTGGGKKSPSTQGRSSSVPLPSSATSSRGNIFLEAMVNKREVFVGEPIQYRLALYRRVQLFSQIQIEQPSFQGFWMEDLKTASEQLQSVGGQRYYVFELLKKALFAIDPGTLTLDPGKVGVVLHPLEGQRVIASRPTEIIVRPLPTDGQPSDFSGIVGDFSLAAETPQLQINQNTPLTVLLTLSGRGNIRSISDLSYDDSPDFRIYKSNISDDLSTIDGVKGDRKFEYIVIPKVSGDLEIPSFRFSYFSLKDKAYKTLKTDPIPFKSIASKRKGTTVVGGEAGDKSRIELLREEIAYLKSPVALRNAWEPVHNALVFKVAVCANIVLLILGVLLGLKRKFFKVNSGEVRRKHAYDNGIKALKKAAFNVKGDVKQVSGVQNAFLVFLGDKIEDSLLGRTQDEIRAILSSQGLSADQVKQINGLLDQLSFMVYTPTAAKADEVATLVRKVEMMMGSLKGWRS